MSPTRVLMTWALHASDLFYAPVDPSDLDLFVQMAPHPSKARKAKSWLPALVAGIHWAYMPNRRCSV